MLKRFILWDFQRGSWQYDVMVGIILAFMFLTPRAWFRDQPRASSIVMVASENGGVTFFVDPERLANVPENQRVAQLTKDVQAQVSNRHLRVTRVEPILNSEGELQGYMAFAHP
jgi:hypothetical protein